MLVYETVSKRKDNCLTHTLRSSNNCQVYTHVYVMLWSHIWNSDSAEKNATTLQRYKLLQPVTTDKPPIFSHLFVYKTHICFITYASTDFIVLG